MAIQDVKCANCGKYLSPVWREKCLHCGVPMHVARPAMLPPQTVMPAQRPVRVQSVLRGPNEAACLQQAVVDGQRAAANGYAPVWQTWGREGSDVTLTILYDIVQATPPAPAVFAAPPPPLAPPEPVAPPPALPPPPAVPTPPPAMPAPAASPVAQSWPAPPAPSMPPSPPPPPVPQPWAAQPGPTPPVAQPVAWAPSQVPQVIVQAPPAAPDGTGSRPSIANRVFGAIISILVVIVVYWIAAAGERALF